MRSHRERGNARPFFLSSLDHLGRRIDSEVLEAAQRIGPRAAVHGEKVLGDPAIALTLLEEVAASVTLAIEAKVLRGEPPIKDLDGYLYRAFMHRVHDEKRRGPRLLNVGDLESKAPVRRADLSEIERKLLLDQLLGTCDTVTADIILRHYSGQKWPEVGAACGISATAARLRFRKAMLRMRRITEPGKDST